VLDAWLVVAVFMLGAACGSLLTRINYKGFEDRMRQELSIEPLVSFTTRVRGSERLN
jgi:hypothetical protein